MGATEFEAKVEPVGEFCNCVLSGMHIRRKSSSNLTTFNARCDISSSSAGGGWALGLLCWRVTGGKKDLNGLSDVQKGFTRTILVSKAVQDIAMIRYLKSDEQCNLCSPSNNLTSDIASFCTEDTRGGSATGYVDRFSKLLGLIAVGRTNDAGACCGCG